MFTFHPCIAPPIKIVLEETDTVLNGFPLMDPITVVKSIQTLVATGVQLQANLTESSNSMIRALHECLAKADALKNVEGAGSYYIKNAIADLKLAVYKYYLFVDSVDDVYWYGRDQSRMTRICEGIQRGDYQELRDFTDLLTRSLSAAEGYYQESVKAFHRAETSSLNGAEHCRTVAREARSKEITTKAVGGTVAAGAIVAGTAGGVAASVVAGLFTFGIGTIVGLSLTAVGSVAAGAAVGTGVSVATHVIASDFNELEEKFTCLSRLFAEVHFCTSVMLDDILFMKSTLVSTSRKVDTAKYVMYNYRQTSNLHCQIKQLFEQFGECYKESSQCRADLKRVHDRFKDS